MLDGYVDGELDSRARREVGAHLRMCWGCSGTVQILLLVRAALRRRHAATDSLPVARLRRFARTVSRS